MKRQLRQTGGRLLQPYFFIKHDMEESVMSQWKEAEEYIAKSRTVILGSVTKEGVPELRTLASFANDGLVVYLSTSKTSRKVGQLKDNPHATLLFQHEGQEIPQFRNVALTGTIAKVCSKCGQEYEHAVKLLGSRNPRFKERAEKGQLEETAILKLTPHRVKLVDLSKGSGAAAVEEVELVSPPVPA
jgi:pyridoxamine 5'-phosphate oxidase